MVTNSPITPRRCTLLEETQVEGKSVISGKWFQAITYFSQGKKKKSSDAVNCYQWCITIKAIKGSAQINMQKRSILHLIGKWTTWIWLGPKVIISLRRSFLFPSALIFLFPLNDFRFSWEISVLFHLEKKAALMWKKGALLKPFYTVDRSCAKLFLCTANSVPLRHKNLFEKHWQWCCVITVVFSCYITSFIV